MRGRGSPPAAPALQAHRRHTNAAVRACDAPRGVSRSRRIARNRSSVMPAGERCCSAAPAAACALRLTSTRCGPNVAPCPRPHRPAGHRQGKGMSATIAHRVCADPSASQDAEHRAEHDSEHDRGHDPGHAPGRPGASARPLRSLHRAQSAPVRRALVPCAAASRVRPCAAPTAARRDSRGGRFSSCPHVRQGGAPSCRNALSPSPITCSPG